MTSSMRRGLAQGRIGWPDEIFSFSGFGAGSFIREQGRDPPGWPSLVPLPFAESVDAQTQKLDKAY
jgi:hypothetical protein